MNLRSRNRVCWHIGMGRNAVLLDGLLLSVRARASISAKISAAIRRAPSLRPRPLAMPGF